MALIRHGEPAKAVHESAHEQAKEGRMRSRMLKLAARGAAVAAAASLTMVVAFSHANPSYPYIALQRSGGPSNFSVNYLPGKAQIDAELSVLQQQFSPVAGSWDTGWWQNANILQTIMQGYQATHNPVYKNDVRLAFNMNMFISTGYNDDEGWWGLTWVMAYNTFHERQYLYQAEYSFNYMKQSWSASLGGGLTWNQWDSYKNAVTNLLYFDLASQIHDAMHRDKYYLGWARRSYRWLMHSGLMVANGRISDGRYVHGGFDRGNSAYLQGLWIGGLVSYAKATHNQYYIRKAQGVAYASDAAFADNDGILMGVGCEYKGICKDLSYLPFKGIYIQNLADLYRATRNPEFIGFMMLNSESIWKYDRGSGLQAGYIGYYWDGPYSTANVVTLAAGIDALLAGELIRTMPPRPGPGDPRALSLLKEEEMARQLIAAERK